MRNRTAIVGIGNTDYRSRSVRSELRMAVEATLAACEDAGIEPDAIDGMCTVSTDLTGINNVASALDLDNLRFFAEIPFGGGGTCAAVGLAAMAVASGRAETVLCYRSLNGRSGARLGGARIPDPRFTRDFQFVIPAGMSTPAQISAVIARRHMHQYGTTKAQLRAAALNSRSYGATNPIARFYQMPLTVEEYDRARMIAEPLCLYDCCLESDAAVALLVTSAERARDLRQRPAFVTAFAQGLGRKAEVMPSFERTDITVCEESTYCARDLWRMAGIGPKDVRVAQVYDHFSPLVLLALEDFGFVPKGESGPWVEGGALGLDGALPTNTSGGQLGEAYVNGMNQIAEAVQQIRGTSPNQVRDVGYSFVCSGNTVPTSALVLAREAS